jgi:hypothetical protein
MHVYTVLRSLAVIAAFSAILFHSLSVSAGQEASDWWKAQGDVTVVLMKPGASIAKLTADVNVATPKNAQDVMFKLCVFMRGGMNKEAIETLQELKARCPNIAHHQVGGIFTTACDNVLALDVAKATAECFADNLSERDLNTTVVRHFLRSGWTVEKVDKWLAGLPKGKGNFWVVERLRLNMGHSHREALVRGLSDSVRKNPQDIKGAVEFLAVMAHAPRTGGKSWDLSWMTESIKPKLATEAEKIASGLKKLGNWKTAIVFYKQALDTPLTEEESKNLQRLGSMLILPDHDRGRARGLARFAAHAREGMAKCLLEVGKNTQAQKWMVEAADIRKKHNLGFNALFAGQGQRASGQRTIEGRIKEKEKKSAKDPQYWRDRALYYRGRNEPALEAEALLKGLALKTPQPDPVRHLLLSEYAHFLEREKRIDDAVAFLRKEIEQAPTTPKSAERAVSLLAYDFYQGISIDDAVLWNWLENRPKWGSTEGRLLERMLVSAYPNFDKHFIRAEKAALGKDPSRAYMLGCIMNRLHFPKRAIPLLKYAIERSHGKEQKKWAALALLKSYLDMGDWKQAEAIFPDAAKSISSNELPEWYSRVAVAAAKTGAKTDAMRIWSQAANLSPSQIYGLEDMAEAGLRNELKDFYSEMQKKMPSSYAPAKALMELEKK